MPSQHLSLRIDSGTLARLDAESRRSERSRSELAKTLIEEGLRMRAHPGIVFRSGPAGRRPGLAAGPDVWEVISTFQDRGEAGHDAVEHVARSLALTPHQVREALRYYAEYKDEIDEWIGRNAELAEASEAALHREQQILSR